MKGFYFICISIILFSCSSDSRPADILPPDKMEKLLWEQIRADAFTKEFVAKDSSKNLSEENLALQQRVFRKYKTTAGIFYKSYDYYLQHNNMMKNLLDSVISKQIRAREKENQALK